MLILIPRAEEVLPQDAVPERLGELTRALEHERRLIDDLRHALRRQRQGVSADDAGAIEASVHAIGRTLLTLDEARRRRIALTTVIEGPVTLDELEQVYADALPADFRAAHAAVRRAAEETTCEVAINQSILRSVIQAGDAFLQQLFSSSTGPMPAGLAPQARPGARFRSGEES
jgi:hypothetical protein